MILENGLGKKQLNSKTVVFSDIDGSLLNDEYKAPEIEPIISRLLELGVAVVFNSSKTAAEIEYYRKKWKIRDPFIVENGSAIFIPKNYFQKIPKDAKQTSDYYLVEFGLPYSVIREKLAAAKTQAGAQIRGFGDFSSQQLAADTGLPLELAELAMQRQYSEPFMVLDGNKEGALETLRAMGLCVTSGGRYLHAMGISDKGRAAVALKKMYLDQNGGVLTMAVGDSLNDLPLLRVVDKPFWVDQKNSREKVWKQILLLTQQASTC